MKKILVINADASARAYLDDVFSCLGFMADWAGSGGAVATLLENNQYDAVILDELMHFNMDLFSRWLRDQFGVAVIVLVDPFGQTCWTNVPKVVKPISASQLKIKLNQIFTDAGAAELSPAHEVQAGRQGGVGINQKAACDVRPWLKGVSILCIDCEQQEACRLLLASPDQ